MKRFFLLIIVLILGYIVWPFANIYMLGQSVKNADLQGLNSGVKWVELRAHLKTELTSRFDTPVLKENAISSKNELLDSLVKKLAPKLNDDLTVKLIDKTVTAENVVRIVNMANSVSNTDKDTSATNDNQALLQDPLKYLNWAFFTGFNEFDVRLRLDREQPYVEFKFELDGFRWKLVRITPPEDFSFVNITG